MLEDRFGGRFVDARAVVTYYPPRSGFLGSPQPATLPIGTRIDRYGLEGGTYVSPAGTPYPMRALPAGSDRLPISTYEVLSPIEVQAGIVAPWFGQSGLGTQYKLPTSVANLVDAGALRRVGVTR